MRKRILALLATVLGFGAVAQADLVSVDVVAGPDQHPDGRHNTWRIVVRFDDSLDRIIAVAGSPDPEYNPIEFSASSDLYNQALFKGLPLNDFPSVVWGGELYDSWVTIGETIGPQPVRFTGEFSGPIAGNHWGPVTDGGWIWIGEPPTVGGFDSIPDNETFDVVVAQFTLDEGSAFTLTGNIAWILHEGDDMITPFEVGVIPAPAPFILLGLAGLARARRRHD